MALDLKKVKKNRLRQAYFISTLQNKLPFVRAVLLTGSMTKATIKNSSDIDLLIIVKSGKIFTARMLCLLTSWLTGLKRSSNEQISHSGKICLNYFLSDDYLTIPHNRSEELNRYCAFSYSGAVLVAGDVVVFDKFQAVNKKWMVKYLKDQKLNFRISTQSSNIRHSNKLKYLMEKLLSGKFGAKLERYFKRIQTKRINNNPLTQKYPHLICANDREMRFHPPKSK